MTSRAVKRNVRRQIRQVWSYVEAKLQEEVDVGPAVLFESAPTDPGRRALIEEMFHAEAHPAGLAGRSVSRRQ